MKRRRKISPKTKVGYIREVQSRKNPVFIGNGDTFLVSNPEGLVILVDYENSFLEDSGYLREAV